MNWDETYGIETATGWDVFAALAGIAAGVVGVVVLAVVALVLA